MAAFLWTHISDLLITCCCLLSYGLNSESVLLPFLGAVGLGMPFTQQPSYSA